MVALFTRAWIEINLYSLVDGQTYVALFTRAWIEIDTREYSPEELPVALFTRAWIEIAIACGFAKNFLCRPLHEGVD